MPILQVFANRSNLPPLAETIAIPGAAETGLALVLLTARPRLRLEIDGLYSREQVRLALSVHLALAITEPLRFYQDFVRTPADYDETQLGDALTALIATALRPAIAALRLEELNADSTLRAWLETAIRSGLREIDLEGRSGLRVETLEAFDLRCAIWDQQQAALATRYLRAALAETAADRPLVDADVLAALPAASEPSPPAAPQPAPQPAPTLDGGSAAALDARSLRSLLHNPPSMLRPEVWRRALAAAVATAPLCAAGCVYIATRDGVVHALHLADGSPVWPQPAQLGAAPGDGMALAAGRLWIPGRDGVLYALHPASGALISRIPIGGSLSSAPLLHDDRLYLSIDIASTKRGDAAHGGDDPAGAIVVIDPHLAQPVARYSVSRHGLRSQPVALLGMLFVGDRKGDFYRIDLQRRRSELLPNVRIGRIHCAPGVDARRNHLIVGGSYGVQAIDVTGQVQWMSRLGGNVVGVAASPLVIGDTVFVGASDGQVYMLRSQDGAPRQPPFATAAPIATPPLAVRHLVVVGSNDGSLYALDAARGALFWSYRSGHPISAAPARTADDLLLAVDTAGNVNALRWCLAKFAEGAKLAESSDPPRWAEAVELWLLAQEIDCALEAAEHAQRWDVVARLAKDLQLYDEAAAACERLAQQPGAGDDAAAAWWQQAATCWRQAGRPEAAQACQLKAAALRSAPLLTLRVVNFPALMQGRSDTLGVAVTNLTPQTATQVRLRCGGHIARHDSAEFGVAAHGERVIDVPVAPTTSGSATLELHLTYADARGRGQPPVELSVRLSVAQPPVIQQHFHGPTITGEGVIIMRGERGRTILASDGESEVQITRDDFDSNRG